MELLCVSGPVKLFETVNGASGVSITLNLNLKLMWNFCLLSDQPVCSYGSLQQDKQLKSSLKLCTTPDSWIFKSSILFQSLILRSGGRNLIEAVKHTLRKGLPMKTYENKYVNTTDHIQIPNCQEKHKTLTKNQ